MKKLSFFTISMVLAFASTAQSPRAVADTLYSKFLTPPNAAQPRVWWHWMNGNITKEGIRKDLEWMKRAGIGGFQNFDAAMLTPQIVKKRLTYMTPEWKEAFQLTTKLADSLHLEMAIAGSPGWSESGGPWVKPEDGMKKIVWKEKRVKKGDNSITIEKPYDISGPFQNIPIQAGFGETVNPAKHPNFYKDIVLLAYRLPDSDLSLNELQPVVSSSGGSFTLNQLTDGNLVNAKLLPSDTTRGYAWIQFSFAKPQTVKAITMVGGGDRGQFGLNGEFKDTRSLEVSDDNIHFKWICYIPAGNIVQQTISIPPTTAQYFRITVKNPTANAGILALFGAGSPKPPPGTQIAEIVLHTGSRVNMFEEKAAFAPATNLYEKATPATSDAIAKETIIDISKHLLPDGKIDWTVPDGNWMILRIGYSLLGIDNHPATPEATGPEVDKLDPVAIQNYFTAYLDQYRSATGGLMGDKGGLQFMVTDSWEAGAQNWTPLMLQEFFKRRGYSLLPWLPVLTGHIVQSAEASDQFLWDYRKTIGEMIAEYHYDNLTELLKKYGMKRYSESHEDGRAIIADGMEVKRKAAIPMAAMWTPNLMNGFSQTKYLSDILESASTSHLYGQNLVAAESFTALGVPNVAWSYSPENLKSTADLELAHGLNRFVVHTSVHQPLDDKLPGLGLGPFGQWFNRHDTWASQAKLWTDYLSRSSYLLQQGKFVADIAYYYGEDNNVTSLFGKKLPDIPEGYSYDFINADALINLLTVSNGNLITPSGMSYRILVLDSNAKKMSLPVLKKIQQLVKAGATITGIIPENSPSLSDDPAQFEQLKKEIWGQSLQKVFKGKSLDEVVNTLKIKPDFSYDKPSPKTKLLFVHRKLKEGELYWVNNRNANEENLTASFRLSGKTPEIWHPETGKKEAASYSIENGITKVELHLNPEDAIFILFREKASSNSKAVPAKKENDVLTVNGDWTVNFQKDRGAPATATFNTLTDWTTHFDPGIKYFSGTASYFNTITIDKQQLNNKGELWLDLGAIKNIAEVFINGKAIGAVWNRPYRINISGSLKPGSNTLEIRVTNLWVNRLIGDMQPGATKYTFTTMPFYQANAPLAASGLLGPVRIIRKL